MEEDYLFPYEDDADNEVIFDQPYFYHKVPQGGHYDDLDFYNFPNGAFITSDGYFFNNLGFDRYGGRLDKDGNYFRVSPAKIEDRDKVQPPPHYEPPKYETSDADHAFKGLDDGYVGEEDFGDDEIFGKSQGAPKYYMKKGEGGSAPIYPKKEAQTQPVKVQSAPKGPKKAPIVIGAASKKQIDHHVAKIEQKKKPQQPQKSKPEQTETKPASQTDGDQKKVGPKEEKSPSAAESKSEAPQEQLKEESGKSRYERGGYQGGRGKDYSRGKRGYGDRGGYQGGRDYQPKGRGYQGGRYYEPKGQYDQAKGGAKAEYQPKKATAPKKRMESNVIKQEKASESAWDF